MKKLLLLLFISYGSFGQIRIIGATDGSLTLTPQGVLTSNNKPSTDFYSNFDIALGYYALNKNMARLGNIAIGNNALENFGTTGGSNIAIGPGSMKNSSGGYANIAIGVSALNNTSSGDNIAMGWLSLYSNSTGYFNIGIGSMAMHSNESGKNNTALGNCALCGNKTGNENVAIGDGSLGTNDDGSNNVSIGKSSLELNSHGNHNFAGGKSALTYNRTGNYNVGVGSNTLYYNQYGNYNTAIGYQAGSSNISSYNTFVGYNADITPGTDFINSMSLGYAATVDASNKVRIGNSAVSVIEGQVPWSNPSDRRLKENILYTNRLGLDFITRLQTVSYNYISDENKTRHDGFIAQDVEKVMQELGVPFSGLKKSFSGTYSLAYSDFVMPLVNAVKEQQIKIENLEKQNQLLSARISEIDEIKAELAKMKMGNSKAESK